MHNASPISTPGFLRELFPAEHCAGLYIDYRLWDGREQHQYYIGLGANPLPKLPAPMAGGMGHNAAYASRLTIGINPRATRGRADINVAFVLNLVLDLDRDHGDLKEMKRRVREVARHAPPTFVVHSGTPGNRHVYWLLKEPEDKERARALVKRLKNYVGADHSQAPSKMMRLPGSHHWKTGKPVLITAHRVPDGRRTTLAELEAILDAVGAPTLPPRSRRGRPTPRQGARSSHEGAPKLSADTIKRVKARVRSLPRRGRQLIKTGASPGRTYHSRSEAVAAAARLLLERGLTVEQAEWVFWQFPRGIGERLTDKGPDSLRRTLDRLSDAVEEDVCVVEVVKGWSRKKRLMMQLRVVQGTEEAEAGTPITQGVLWDHAVWGHFARSLGMAGATRALPPVGSTARVVLGQHAKYGLTVKRWLPPALGPAAG